MIHKLFPVLFGALLFAGIFVLFTGIFAFNAYAATPETSEEYPQAVRGDGIDRAGLRELQSRRPHRRLFDSIMGGEVNREDVAVYLEELDPYEAINKIIDHIEYKTGAEIDRDELAACIEQFKHDPESVINEIFAHIEQLTGVEINRYELAALFEQFKQDPESFIRSIISQVEYKTELEINRENASAFFEQFRENPMSTIEEIFSRSSRLSESETVDEIFGRFNNRLESARARRDERRG